MKKKISIIGAGNLTLSLLSSIEACSKDYIISIVDNNRSRKRLLKKHKVSFVSNIDNNISDSKVIFLNVKPKDSSSVLKSLKPYVGAKNIIISFMAGIKVNDIKKALDTETSVIRCMTNITAINNDAIIFYFMKKSNKQHSNLLSKVFKKQKQLIECKSEDELNKITALYGSAPAYYILFNETIKNIYKKLGYTSSQASKLSDNLFIGTANLIKSGLSGKDLINSIASKGGTTEAALKELSKSRIDKSLYNAIKTAIKKSKELAKN